MKLPIQKSKGPWKKGKKQKGIEANTYVVRAQSFNRKTGKPTSKPRNENIHISRNELFTNATSSDDVKEIYETFWNSLNSSSEDVVRVISVSKNY